MPISKVIMARNFFVFLLLSLVLMNCSKEQPFNSEIWKQKGRDWWMTDVRENMLTDLIISDTLNGLTNIQVVELLGEPESTNQEEITYLVREKYESGIDPVYIKHLLIRLDSLNTVTDYKIETRK
tara:strand:+ start:593 stop:967 length:375 start_codon:yes stop_codon:yes gene_type:complete